jgi:uncharacterized protein (DUF1499 family)
MLRLTFPNSLFAPSSIHRHVLLLMVLLLTVSVIDGFLPPSSSSSSIRYSRYCHSSQQQQKQQPPQSLQAQKQPQQQHRRRTGGSWYQQLLQPLQHHPKEDHRGTGGGGISSFPVPSYHKTVGMMMVTATIVLLTAGMGPLGAVAEPTTASTDDANLNNDGTGATTTATTTTLYSIQRCSVSSQSPCISTSNVKQINLYSPPWTFTSAVSPDEVMSRLKGAILADPSCTILQQDGNKYLAVQAQRPSDIFGTIDKVEFVINDIDQVVTYKSSAPNDSTGTDFGIQRKRLDEIRKRSGIFGMMGDTLKTADTRTNSERGNGPIGQLKAFYGLQSGGGFEDVLAE